jgi:EmrB/QacA subfamily drug resistance transporter
MTTSRPVWRPSSRRWLILAIASAATFLTILDLWAVTIAFPALEKGFAATVGQVSWVLNAYSILLAALLVPAGRLADVVGRKRCFLTGLAAFGIASLGCALAPSLGGLVAARCIQSVAAAVLMPTSLGVVLAAFPPADRGVAVGIWAAVGALAASAGPVLGGVLVTFTWRWIFLINVPIVVVGLAAGVIYLPVEAVRMTRSRVDGIGAALVFLSMTAVCTGLVNVRAWSGPWVAVAFGVGFASAGALLRQLTRHPQPIVAPQLFKDPLFRAAALGILAYYVGFSAMLLGATLLLTDVWHFTVLRAALAIAPGPIVSSIVAPISGRYGERFGFRRTVLLGATVFGFAGAWPMLMAGEDATYFTALLPGLLLWGFANGLLQPILFATAQKVPAEHLGSGSAVLTMSRQLASALGVAILVAVMGDTMLPGLRRGWLLVIVSALLVAASVARVSAASRANGRCRLTRYDAVHDRRTELSQTATAERPDEHLGRDAKPHVARGARRALQRRRFIAAWSARAHPGRILHAVQSPVPR